jgi:hypothetical protein
MLVASLARCLRVGRSLRLRHGQTHGQTHVLTETGAHRPCARARPLVDDYRTMLVPMPTLMWPYVLPWPGTTACGALCCSRPPLTVLSLVGAGLGLPLSEEVLVLGLGAQLPDLGATRQLCVLLWALVGIVMSDLATVTLGSQLRTRSDALRASAPRFLGRLLRSIGVQLDMEARRDARRLEEQLARRLRATASSATELLRTLGGALGGSSSSDPRPAPSPIEPSVLRLKLVRRLTCERQHSVLHHGTSRAFSNAASHRRVLPRARPPGNTRTALAAAGQAGPRLLSVLTSSQRRSRTAKAREGGRAAAASSFAAAIDNRFGMGQRWPLALLTGLDGPVHLSACSSAATHTRCARAPPDRPSRSLRTQMQWAPQWGRSSARCRRPSGLARCSGRSHGR